MMRAVVTAAGRQARVVAGLKQASEWTEAKKKHQEKGSCAAHLAVMIHENKNGCAGSFIIVDVCNFSNSKEKSV
jgi:hypothetical protein